MKKSHYSIKSLIIILAIFMLSMLALPTTVFGSSGSIHMPYAPLSNSNQAAFKPVTTPLPTLEIPTREGQRGTPVPTEVTPTEQPPAKTDDGGSVGTRLQETFCAMNIGDQGDNNPFTYQFTVGNNNNIASYEWLFGDSGTAITQTATHTYTQIGTFTITLRCTPQPGFGSVLELTGSITISSSPVADFELTPSDVYTGLPPFVVSTVNHSTGGGLSYQWKISTSNDPMDAAAVIYSATTPAITYTFTSAEITSYPAVFYFYLTATDGAGLSSYMMKSVVFNAPQPSAKMKITPGSGSAPLIITAEGVDLNTGPITNWTWDFNTDGTIDATGIGPHTYTYNTDGIYTVTMNYTGPGGGGNATRQVGVFPALNPVQSQFTYQLMGNDVGGINVCFTNTSTGPVAVSKWDWDGNGTYDLTSNEQVVCHIYPSQGVVTVKLRVENSGATSTSTSSQAVNVMGSPVASFTVNPGTNITWGTPLNFTDISTGIITNWSWDFNGDGATDSTTQNPTNIQLADLGANPVRLTVTGPGGTSYVEIVIFVARLELSCGFTGNLNVLPGAGAQTYTSTVGNQGGRPITYNWTITGTGTGLPMTFATPNINVNWAAIGYGAFQVTLDASTADGSACSTTKTVNVSWTPLNCQMNTTLPGTLYADGANYTFTANVSNLNGRAVLGYEWYVNDVLQGTTGNVFTWTNTTDTSSLPAAMKIHYVVLVNNGAGYTPTTSTCTEARTFTIQQWPTLVCNTIGGTTNPLPSTPDNVGRSYNYTANIGGVGGRPASYQWTVSDGTITSTNPRLNNNQAAVIWNASAGTFPPAPVNDSVSVVVTLTNPDSTTVSCSMGQNIAVTINRLVCNLPGGDTTPVVGETVNYTTNVVNGYGRTWASLVWDIEQLSPTTSTWTDTSNPLSLSFMVADARYRIRYTVVVNAAGSLPGDNCTSGWQPLTVYGTGLNFECEGNLLGNAAPNNPAGSYTYTIDMDNGNNIALLYQWVLTDYLNNEYLLNTPTPITTDGIISSPAFSLTNLAPLLADHYNLRVDVSAVDTGVSSYACSKDMNLTVGTVTVNYTYNAGSWINTAVPINHVICLINTSAMVPGSINDLDYSWEVSGSPANNSWGISSRPDQQPPCISFSQPGAYTLKLTGMTHSTLMSGSRTIVFTVYGLQSILINHTGSSFAPSSQGFGATGTNITGGYTWQFRRVSDNGLIGNKAGQNVSQNFTTPDTYRATVTGTGPLGATSASLEFTLMSPGSLAAAFTASQYGGIAPMNVCFTDGSVSGSQIIQWEWDFDGDGNYDLIYDDENIPSSICYDYTVPDMAYPVSLRVTNASFNDTATNTIRTYNLVESSATFSITPQGSGSFCFTAILEGGIFVTGWEFGDGGTGPAQNTVCYTYGASGTYLVTMQVSDGTTTGDVVRVVVVDLTNSTPPVLDIAGNCAVDTTAIFTITNNGGSMTIADQVIVRDADGNVILIAPVQLGAGASTTFTVSGYAGDITLNLTDLVVTVSTNCVEPPILSGSSTCQIDGSAVFTITNTSSETAANQAYEIRDASNNLIDSGTLVVPIGGSTTVTVSGVWGLLTLTSSGIQGPTTVLSVDSNCDTPPLLSVSSTCLADSAAVFTITNTSPDTAASQSYEIHDASNNLIDSGTINVPANGSTTVTVNGVYHLLTFTSSGAEGVTTVISTTSNCVEPPLLTGYADCALDGVATFTIANSSTDTAANQSYEIRDTASNLIDSGTLIVPVQGMTSITITGTFVEMTLTSTGTQGATTELTVTTDCAEPPILTASSTCLIDGTAVFTIINTSTESAANQSYEIRDASNNLIDSGTLIVPIGGSTDLTVTGTYGLLTLTSSGLQGSTTVISVTSDCDQPPVLTGYADCALDGVATFTIANNSTDTEANQSYEIRDLANNLIDSGTLIVPVQGTTSITITGTFVEMTLTSTGTQGVTTELTVTTDCAEPPILSASSTCLVDGTAVFTIINTSTESAANQSYEIRDASNNLIDSGTLIVPIGGSTDLTVTGTYGLLTLTSSGLQGVTTVISVTSDCDQPPVLTGYADCALDGVATFTIANSSTDTEANQAYEIRDLANNLIDAGTLIVPVQGTTSITITGTFVEMMLTSSGTQGVTTDLTVTTDCDQPPVLTATSTCQLDGTTVFTIINSSTETAASQSYEIRDTANNLVQTGTLDIPINGSVDVTVMGTYGLLTLTSSGTQGSTTVVSITSTCGQPPVLSGSATCETGVAIFTITNSSTDSTANQSYSVVDSSNTTVQTGTLSIPAGGDQTVKVVGYTDTLTFSTVGAEGVTTELQLSTVCETPTDDGDNTPDKPGDDDNDDERTGDNGDNGDLGDDTTHYLPPLDLTPQQADTAFVARPAWAGINLGAASCQDWLIYHTDMTGDWEVYRLGDGGDAQLAQYDPNLSQGRGADVTDMAPTRSPDNQWIAFTSNRDSTPENENWELYIASVDNTIIRRVTYNTFAKDIDPAWSPDGRYLVFESDRDGNWELYLFDLSTGVETRLTDDLSNDINAFWATDSRTIVFQSDRDGMWQIYSADIATTDTTRLSDGTSSDQDPALAFDGQQIAFRSYDAATGRSAINMMKINGADRIQVSDTAGSASNHTWSANNQLIAYQSNLDGDLDIYVYEVKTGKTRLVTDNAIADYAPTWICSSHTVVFTSNVLGNPDIFNTPADPMENPAILVDKQANQMTFDLANDVYPENSPSEENASREGNVPPTIDAQVVFID